MTTHLVLINVGLASKMIDRLVSQSNKSLTSDLIHASICISGPHEWHSAASDGPNAGWLQLQLACWLAGQTLWGRPSALCSTNPHGRHGHNHHCLPGNNCSNLHPCRGTFTHSLERFLTGRPPLLKVGISSSQALSQLTAMS